MPAEMPILVLLSLLAVSAVTDVWWHKIYNGVTYPGVVLGLGLNFLAAGQAGLQQSVAGFFGCGAIMLVCFLLFHVGGGDVKLIAMMGAFLGFRDGVEAMLWTFVLGGVAAVAVLIWQIGIVNILKGTMRHLWLMARTGSRLPLNPEEREPLQRSLYLAPSGLLAVLLVTGRDMM